jgi:hypothetical protein
MTKSWADSCYLLDHNPVMKSDPWRRADESWTQPTHLRARREATISLDPKLMRKEQVNWDQ